LDDRLPVPSYGRVQGIERIVEFADVSDVCPQSSVSDSLDDLIQLRTIRLENEIHRQTYESGVCSSQIVPKTNASIKFTWGLSS
jgi:hypothetical protein